MSSKLHDQIAKSREQALVAFVAKKAEIDAMLTRLQTLGHYASLLKRITDSAFNEGEHAE